MHCPLPLAAIAIRRDLAPHLAPAIDRALRASVEYAFAHPDASRDYVAAHAQEMDPDVTARHIQLYVNDYTLALDETRREADAGVGTSARVSSPAPNPDSADLRLRPQGLKPQASRPQRPRAPTASRPAQPARATASCPSSRAASSPGRSRPVASLRRLVR